MKPPSIRSAMSPYETARLEFWARGRSVVEMGALLGYSTVVMARVARGVVSIDRHTGYDNKPNDTERIMRCNLERYSVAKKVTVVVGDYREVAKWPSDLAFVDLDGTAATTWAAAWLSQARLVAIHDFARQNCQGVARCVSWMNWTRTYRVIDRAESLVVLRRR